MMQSIRIFYVARLIAALVLGFTSPWASATTAKADAPAQITECLGYHTIQLQGDLEYALMSNFSQRLGAWGSEISLKLDGLKPQALSISQPAGRAELNQRLQSRNSERQREIDDVVGRLERLDPTEGDLREVLAEKLSRLRLFVPMASGNAISRIEKDLLEIHALVNGHIFYTSMPPQGTPEQTLDAFLSHYKPRALGEVPDGPGVCVPYGFFTREKQPATIGLNIRLKDQPDIVVYLRASDAATDAPDDPDKFFARALWPGRTFFQARGEPVPMRRFMQREKVTIDGASGTGIFVTVRRDDDPYPTPINNAANGNRDWAYLAYVPGVGGGKPGDSFNITFKVERFGRFAQRPMTEREFRDLTLRIAASIKRRPGAWVAN